MTRIFTVVLTLIFLAGLAVLTLTAPITPDEDDCRARGQASDCWRFEVDKRSEPRP